MKYDVIIIGAGPGGIFTAYELMQLNPDIKVAVFEAGHALSKRHCPIDGEKVKSCIGCNSCSIMSGFGGAGAFSDGKYNITNDFGGTLHEYIGKNQALSCCHRLILYPLIEQLLHNEATAKHNGHKENHPEYTPAFNPLIHHHRNNQGKHHNQRSLYQGINQYIFKYRNKINIRYKSRYIVPKAHRFCIQCTHSGNLAKAEPQGIENGLNKEKDKTNQPGQNKYISLYISSFPVTEPFHCLFPPWATSS